MKAARDIPQKNSTTRRAEMTSATTAFPWARYGADAHDQQRIDALPDGLRAMHEVKSAGIPQPKEFRVRNVKRTSVRKVDGEWKKRLTIKSLSNFPDHRIVRRSSLSSGAALPCAAWCFRHLDDRGGIEAFRPAHFLVPVKQCVEARPRMHFAPTLHHQFPPVLESDNKRLEWFLDLTVEDFLEHESTVGTVRKTGKEFF